MKIQFPKPSFPLFASVLLSCAACTVPHPLRGGKALTTPGPTGGLVQTLAQSENPSAPTRQSQQTIRTRTYTLPLGTRVNPTASPIQQSNNPPIQPAFVVVTEREETRANTELGAAQKDTARELGAKLSSLKGIVWVGVGLFIFGIASLFWPPLRIIVGSLTTSAALTLGGVALMVLPTLVVGHELLILGGVALAVGAWFLAHRHGHLRGQLTEREPSLARSSPEDTNSAQNFRVGQADR